jgi:predicted small secreted protein
MTALRSYIAQAPAKLRAALLLTLLAAVSLSLTACTDIYGVGHRDLEIMWPRQGAVLYDVEVLRARVRGLHLEEYDIYWYVDDRRERRMWNEWYDRPEHKAYEVDTWFWNWRGRGPYTVGFTAVDRRGREIAHRTVRVYVE